MKSGGRDEDEVMGFVSGAFGVLDQTGEFGFEGHDSLRSGEGLGVTEEADDEVGLESGEPLVG